MYYISKVKSWIKRARHGRLIYSPEAEMISDNYAIIRVTQDMKPIIFEVFRHLDGGVIEAGTINNTRTLKAEIFYFYMKLRDESNQVKVVDSKLKFVDGKNEFRVLYVKETGKKVFINDAYVAMIKDFDSCELYLCKDWNPVHRSPVHVVRGLEVISLIMPFAIKGSLKELADSFEFKVGDADVERIDA